jgi:hypothetical protein
VVQYDDTQSIGRRYRRQDEIGTPFCVTVDFQSIDDNQVTVRERDSMQQIRIPIAELKGILAAKIAGEALSVGTKVWKSGEGSLATLITPAFSSPSLCRSVRAMDL